MPLLTLMLVIIVAGIALWLVNAYVPMTPALKNILNIVVAIVVILFCLQAFGLLDALRSVRVPRL